MTIPLPPYVAPYKPVPQVTPFTYRDGITMLKKVELLQRYINKELVPWVNKNMSELGNAFEIQANALIAAVNTAIAENDEQVDAKILELTEYVNAQVDMIINDSIEVQDPVLAGILSDDDSESRNTINNISGFITAPPASGVDDTAALVNIFEKAATFGLGVKFRHNEIYRTNPGGIRLSGGTIRIDGNGATIRLEGGDIGSVNYPAIECTDADYFSVTNLKIDGNDDDYETVNWYNYRHGINVANVTRVKIDDTAIFNYPSVAINVTECENVSISNTHTYDGQYHGIAISTCANVKVSNNNFDGRGDMGASPASGGCGIIVMDSDNVKLLGNHVKESSDSGIKAEGCSDLFILYNRVVDSGKDAIKGGGTPTNIANRRAVAIGNVVERINAWRPDGSSLMQFYDTQDIVIQGNILIGGGERTHTGVGELPEDGIRLFNIYSTGDFTRKIVVTGNLVSNVTDAGLTASHSARDMTIANNRFEGEIDIQGSPSTGDITRIDSNIVYRSAMRSSKFAIRVNGFSGSVDITNNTVSNYLGLYICSVKPNATIDSLRITGNTATHCHNRGGIVANYGGVDSTIKYYEVSNNVLINIVEGAQGWAHRIDGTNLLIKVASFTGNRLTNDTVNAVEAFINIVGTSQNVKLLTLDNNAHSGTVTTPYSGLPNVERIEGLSYINAPSWGAWKLGDTVANSAPAESGTVGSKYVVEGWVCTAAGSPGTWLPRRVLTGN